ncbi:Leucine-rich repeat domain, L domain-like [Phytophthora cactorum]|nr:Leucine-rich repeat domain, L domain-like [Phytophthora cactorum]
MVRFRAFTLHLCWFGFIGLHGFGLAYFSTIAWCYWNLSGTYLNVWITYNDLGIGTKHYHSIAVVHGCLAAIYLAYLVWMFGWSFKKRRLVIAVFNVFSRPGNEKKIGTISRLYHSTLARMGILDVDGPYFDLVLLFREIVETALQTQQAYRMSLLLPRTELNRGYAAMLVINCWSTALVHSVFHMDATKRRLLAVLADCALDLVTSVGITTVLLAIYFPDFDVELSGFLHTNGTRTSGSFMFRASFRFYWYAHGVIDLAGHFCFEYDQQHEQYEETTEYENAKKTEIQAKAPSDDCDPLNPSLSDATDSRTQSKLDIVVASESRITQILFFVWGFAILAVHLYAESISELPQCKMQVKPWMTTEPSCSLLVFDCYESKINGQASEFISQWSHFDRKTTSRVVIHPAPSSKSRFTKRVSQMEVLKVYNSTIASWNESAALSQSYHPNLMMLYLVRVNLPNGELPAGLLSDDFPLALGDIELCATNLRSLPEDLDLKWPKFASIYLERCELTEVPESLARLAPFDLSLAMNPISTLPPSLLEGGVGYLHVGSTLISELPANVTEISSFLVFAWTTRRFPNAFKSNSTSGSSLRVWGVGVIVLVLHVHASMQTPLFECTPKVFPMAGALPSCYTVTFDCYCVGISGLKREVTSEWDGFDRSTTVKLRILHCPSLEVPDSFQDFSGLQDLLVYNSTILDWGDAAALTNTNHPKMKQMTILRVNMTGGSLPLGFQSLDFPAQLVQIIFSETNLETLPDDLDAKWLAGSVVQLENSKLVAVPSGLVRSQPYYLVLTGNPITRLPPELFEGDIQYIYLGRTKVNELPETVTPISLSTLDITNTNISYFPSWIDPLVEVVLDMYPLVFAGGSIYCSELEKIMSGVTTDFNRSAHSSLLMNASEANWEVLNQAVDCSPPLLKTQFSLDYFDATYGLGQ